MNNRTIAGVKALAISVLSLIQAAGCRPEVPAEPVLAIIAVDVSCPAEGRKLGYAKTVHDVQRRLPRGSRVRVYAFAQDLALIYDGPVITGRDTFNKRAGESLYATQSVASTPGTRTEIVLGRLAGDAESSALPCIVWVATDGGMEDRSDAALARLGRATQRLRRCSKLRVLNLVGVRPEHRLSWEAWLRPLGARAAVHGDQDGSLFAAPTGGVRLTTIHSPISRFPSARSRFVRSAT